MNFNAVNARALLVYLKDPWTASWIASGLIAVFVPIITWSTQRGAYYNAYGYALELEEEQKQYYENQDGDDGNQDGDDGNYYTTYKECSWINWPCRKRQYYYATMDDGNDENGDGQQTLPNWFIFLGGADNSEDMQRYREENTGVRATSVTPSGLKFVYAWTLIMFFALYAFGAFSLVKKHNVSNLVVLLSVSASLGLMNMIMAAQGVISSDDRDMEDSYYGWYGQIGILMAYTNFWIMLFSIAFLSAFGVRSYLEKKAKASDEAGDEDDAAEKEGDYQEYNAPVVEMS
jgi:hypothetical protein